MSEVSIVRAAFERFMAMVEQSDLADISKDNYREHIGRFIKWLEGRYTPKGRG